MTSPTPSAGAHT